MKPKSETLSEEMEELAAKALRPTQRVGAEDLIASELASAVLSTPLDKIRHACEALMILGESEKAQAGITEEEEKEAEKIYTLAVSLANIYVGREIYPDGSMGVDYCSIPWPFTSEKAGDWLDWAATPKKSAGDIYRLSNCSKIENGRILLTRFLRYAMPKATTLMKKIIHVVSPDSYMQALQILRGGRIGKPRSEARKSST